MTFPSLTVRQRLSLLLMLWSVLTVSCSSPAQPPAGEGISPALNTTTSSTEIDTDSIAPAVYDTGLLFTKSEAVNPSSDDPSRPWELVWALTEDTFNEKELFVTVHRRLNPIVREHPEFAIYDLEYTAAIYVQVEGKYKLLHRLNSNNGYFLEPNYFQAQPKGESSEKFLQITEIIYGTGHFVQEHIFYPRADAKLETVAFASAPDFFKSHLAAGETAHESENNSFTDSGLSYDFFIWKDTDANCCPSAGEVTGTYKIERLRREGPYQISVDTYSRGPVKDCD